MKESIPAIFYDSCKIFHQNLRGKGAFNETYLDIIFRSEQRSTGDKKSIKVDVFNQFGWKTDRGFFFGKFTLTTTTTQQYKTTQPGTYTKQVSITPVYTEQQTYKTRFITSGFGVAQKPQSAFKLLRQGSGISPNEQQGIVFTAMAVYQSGITSISNNTINRIKKLL